MDRTTTAERIRRLRDLKAWTQERLADAAGVSVRTVQRAEEGTMSAETLNALASALGVHVEKLSAPAPGVPIISPVLYYEDPASLDWLAAAFGLETRMKIPGPDGQVLHAELFLGEARIIVGPPVASRGWTTPANGGCRTQSVYALVDDPDAHCARARAGGARILVEPEDVHGQRRYLAEDCEGHHWWFFALGAR